MSEIPVELSGGSIDNSRFIIGNSQFDSNGHLRPDFIYPSNHLDSPATRLRLLDHGADPGVVSQIYDEEGKWVLYGEDDLPGLYRRLWWEIRTELGRKFAPLYNVVDANLLAAKTPNGFSKHSWEAHIVPVADLAQSIAELGKYDDQTRSLLEIAVDTHDIGNIEDRDTHGFESIPRAIAAAPSLLQDSYGLAIVTAAVEWHDEKSAVAQIRSWGEISAEEKIAEFRQLGSDKGFQEHLPRIIAALILADKADTDRRRRNDNAVNPFAMLDDPHVRVVMLSKNGGFRLSPDGSTLIHRVNFNPYISEEDYGEYEAIARTRRSHGGYKVDVPQFIQDFYKEGIPHFDTWKREYKRIYGDRIKLSALMAPVALPQVQYYALELHDMVDESDPEAGETNIEKFTPALFDKHGAIFDDKYVSKKERRSNEFMPLYQRKVTPEN